MEKRITLTWDPKYDDNTVTFQIVDDYGNADDDFELRDRILNQVVDLALERGRLPEAARGLELDETLLLLPLEEAWENDARLRPKVAAFLRQCFGEDLTPIPTEITIPLAWGCKEVSPPPRYAKAFARWRAFLDGDDRLPGPFILELQGYIEPWLDFVVSSPRFPQAIARMRERMEMECLDQLT